VAVSGQQVGLAYAYAPGEEHDGVTIELPSAIAIGSVRALGMAVPGLAKKWSISCCALCRNHSPRIDALPPRCEIVQEFQPSGLVLGEFAGFLRRRYGVEVAAPIGPVDALPAHLRPRIAITTKAKTLGVGRDLAQYSNG